MSGQVRRGYSQELRSLPPPGRSGRSTLAWIGLRPIAFLFAKGACLGPHTPEEMGSATWQPLSGASYGFVRCGGSVVAAIAPCSSRGLSGRAGTVLALPGVQRPLPLPRLGLLA
jgi:hypothetical protein